MTPVAALPAGVTLARRGAGPGRPGLLERSLATEMAAMAAVPVAYRDVLGEGESAWHDAPRCRYDEVNCVTWLQTIVARAYAGMLGRPVLDVLDTLRYYGGIPAFGLRKHFTEQWLYLDPGPLRHARLAGEVVRWRSVSLEPARLRRQRQYGGLLFAEDVCRFGVAYYDFAALHRGLTLGQARPASRFLVAFGVPTSAYLERHGDASGPLALVHALLVELPRPVPGRAPVLVHHASTAAGRVLCQTLEEFLSVSVGSYTGLALFALDARWGSGLASAGRVATAARLVEAARVRKVERQLPKDREVPSHGF